MPYEVILYRKNSGQVMGQFGPYARKADADADARALSTQSNPDWGTMVKKVGAALGRGAKATGRGIAKGVKHGTEYAREGAARASETALDTASKAKDAVVMAKLSGRVEGLESCYEALGGRGALGGVKLEGLGAYREAQDELHDYQEGSRRGAYKRKTSRETAREKRAGARESRLAANPGVSKSRIANWIKKTGISNADLSRIAKKAYKGYHSREYSSGWEAGDTLSDWLPKGQHTTDGSKRAWGDFLIDYGESLQSRKNPRNSTALWSRNDWRIEWYDPQKKWRGFHVTGKNHADHASVFSPGVRSDAPAQIMYDRPESVPKYVQAAVSRLAHQYADDLDLQRNPRSRKNPKFGVGDKVKYSADGLRSRPERGHLRGVITAAPPEGGPNPPDCYSVDWTYYNEIIKTVEKPTALAGDLVAASSKSRKNGSSPLKFSFQWSKEGGSVKFRKGKAGKVGRIEVSVTPRSVFPAYLYEDAPNWGSLKDYINVVRSDGGKAVPYDTKVKVYKAAQEALESEMVKQR